MRIADGKYVVQSVSPIKYVSADTQLIEIGFKDREYTAYLFGVYADVLTYLNQEVEVSFREEIIEGSVRPLINNITIVRVVTTLDKEKDVKLFITDLPDTASNVIFEDMEINETITGAIIYCTHQTFDASKKANWVNLVVQDKKRVSKSLKLFDPDTYLANFVGKFIRADIKMTKFGLNTHDIIPVDDMIAPTNPEIEIARAYILEATKGDEILTAFMNNSGIIQSMSTYIDEDEPEFGYILIRTALEIEEVLDYKNTSPIIDVQLMIRAIMLRKGYTVTNKTEEVLSKQMQNILAVSQYGGNLMTKKNLNMLEEKPRIELLEWELLNIKQAAVDVMIKARKFRTHTLSNDKIWRSK